MNFSRLLLGSVHKGSAVRDRFVPIIRRAVVTTPYDTPYVSPHVAPSVTPPVAVLVRLIGATGELGNAEIRQLLGLRDRTHLRERYLNPCLEGGWIEMTVPDKPTSRLQCYRLTAEGRGLLTILSEDGKAGK